MRIDYIGQEVIWKLLCNHPYEKNFRTLTVAVQCHSEAENKDIVAFILQHIPQDKILDIIMGDNIFNENGNKLVESIKIKNVFCSESELRIINSIPYDTNKRIEELKKELRVKSNDNSRLT